MEDLRMLSIDIQRLSPGQSALVVGSIDRRVVFLMMRWSPIVAFLSGSEPKLSDQSRLTDSEPRVKDARIIAKEH